MVRHPLFWAAVLTAIASPWYLAGDGIEFVPFVLALVTGWLCAFAFVGAAVRMPPRRGFAVHLAGAVAAGVWLWFLAGGHGGALTGPSQPAAALVSFLQFAAPTTAGWVWITLIGRIAGLVGAGGKQRAEARSLPAWERDDDAWMLSFNAVPMRTRSVAIAAALVTALAATVGAVLLFAFYDRALAAGPYLVILALGVVVALPTHTAFSAIVRRRTVAARVWFGRSSLRIQSGEPRHPSPTLAPFDLTIAYRDLDEVTWREDGQFARLEVRTRGGRVVSLLAGFARVPRNVLVGLPPLHRRTVAALIDAGLTSGAVSPRALGVAFERAALDVPRAPQR